MRQYLRLAYGIYFGAHAWEFAGLGLVVFSGLGARLRDLAARRARAWLARAALCFALLSLFMLMWRLPFSLAGYLLERTYGLGTQGPGLWAADLARGYLFGLLRIPVVWLGYWLIAARPRTWWIWLWALTAPLLLVMSVVWPVFVAPAYNRFTPLPDSPLRKRLMDEARKAGIGGAEVLVADVSRRTTRLNAYVAGLGPTRRIVIRDNTLRALDDNEIVAIVGHEMGHYVLGHVWQGFLAGCAGSLALLGLLAWILPRAVARAGPRAGISAPGDLASMPLAVLILSVLLFLQTPLANAFTRRQEREADRFGLNLTGLRIPTARAFARFASSNFSDPNPPPFIQFWFGSHPTLRERIELALSYHAGDTGAAAGRQ